MKKGEVKTENWKAECSDGALKGIDKKMARG